MTAFRRLGAPLTTMLDRPELHPRLGTQHSHIYTRIRFDL